MNVKKIGIALGTVALATTLSSCVTSTTDSTPSEVTPEISTNVKTGEGTLVTDINSKDLSSKDSEEIFTSLSDEVEDEINDENKTLEKITVKIVTDTSVLKDDQSFDTIIERIKAEPFLSKATIEVVDYNTTPEEAVKVLKDNNLELVPTVILNTKNLNDDGVMSNSLKELESGNYMLETGSFYNPVTKEIIDPNKTEGTLSEDLSIENKKVGLLHGKEDSKVSVVIFSDFDCPYCKQSHESTFLSEVIEKIKDKDVNIIFKHFPLEQLHPESKNKSILAVSEILNSEDLMIKSSMSKYFGEIDSTLLPEVDYSEAKKIVESDMSFGSAVGIMGTPSVLVLNNETRQYSITGIDTSEKLVSEINKISN